MSSRLREPQTHRLLSFAEFKTRQSGSNQSDIYDPKLESFPDDPWYSLQHDDLNHSIRRMCDDLLQVLGNSSARHSELANLKTALESATIVPRGEKFYVAFLGEQGIGKSSIINAVFDRELVNVSGSSSACTAYPTIITHKEGAEDSTSTSDVRIEFLSEQEFRDCTEEQIRRYVAAFPSNSHDQPTHQDAGIGERLSDEDEEVMSDGSASDEEPVQNTGHRGRAKVSQAVLRGAKTAKAYFDIIFNVDEDESKKAELKYWLENTDIEKSDFLTDCLTMIEERLAFMGVQEGFLSYPNITDQDLAETWGLAHSIYPLVKAVHLATGHILLRNNVCVLDLPGYGDDNQIRTALIDRYRKTAHFEVVVAPSSRVVSSMIQERYLDRSIRRLNGSRNTLLVTNKSDQLVNEIRRSLNKLGEAPFPELRGLLYDSMAKRGKESASILRAYKDYIMKEARRAFIEREAAIVELQMQAKGVEVLSVSARQYMLCVDPLQDEEPKLSPEATGIPALRHYLFSLPAQTNYRTLRHHVFETLPDLTTQITRILEKFSNNEDYARMREILVRQAAKLRELLESCVKSLPVRHVETPWSANDKHAIISQLKVVIRQFVHPVVYYGTFAKMLRENGIPVSGKGVGRNLNQEVLSTMNGFIETWNVKMMAKIEGLAAELEAPIGVLLRNTKDSIETLSGNPDLKRAANNVLERTSRRLAMAYGRLSTALTNTLRENYLHFTTEINVYCPFAQELKPIYLETLQYQPGKGVYARQRDHLSQAITYEPDYDRKVFTERMEAQILKAQVDAWRRCSDEFVREAISLLGDLERATEDLLDDEANMTPEFGQAQEQLRAMLPQFNQRLKQVQEQFPRSDTDQSTRNTKRKRDDTHTAMQPPDGPNGHKKSKTSTHDMLSRAKPMQPPTLLVNTARHTASSQASYGRAMSMQPLASWTSTFGGESSSQNQHARATSSQPVAHLRQRFLSRFGPPAIKEEDLED